ncbi:flagellar protein FliS [Domibacillus sp. PGB-M46]|uniref:flagellar export chaperone FliS n=1 Tax=Domibacillus sp. PGB-M46 TaxID=2910255 RepID=UPI001F583887|nr:flagellar protein FliS [Domibacillus sp. PGB-M46]MCI2253009.1 flagellar protein FliS [Domibacillus sp. PGB-M46]
MITKEMIYQKTPQQITALLYEAGLTQFDQAIAFLEEKQYAEANKAMQKINDITERLGAGLNYEAGIIADQLDHVYNFIADTVIQANMYKDAERLQQARQLFETIAEAWNEASKTATAKPAARKTNAYEQNIFVEARPANTFETGN